MLFLDGAKYLREYSPVPGIWSSGVVNDVRERWESMESLPSDFSRALAASCGEESRLPNTSSNSARRSDEMVGFLPGVGENFWERSKLLREP